MFAYISNFIFLRVALNHGYIFKLEIFMLLLDFKALIVQTVTLFDNRTQ